MSLYWYEKHWKEKETEEFVKWFESDYGVSTDFSNEEDDQDEYWRRRGFTLYGYLRNQQQLNENPEQNANTYFLGEFSQHIPEYYGEAIKLYPFIKCENYEWDNRTTFENTLFVLKSIQEGIAK